ncbi:MAG: DNA polymerase I [Sphaerochaetaceae bacterium]|jgi:DNA polymerase-1|nr:DNA polymerase I [Sphaerochaetaceae bacterium]HHU88857.1 DNA polymerase I [Spirochaetales bacterium]
MKKETLYIIDGYGLIYRSYFAFINNPLRDMEGNNVSALFGFFNSLLMVQREYNPDYLVVAMDTAAPTFRHKLYKEYKANREAAPQDLHAQVPKIEAILESANIPRIGVDGWEADDVIASLAKCASEQNIETIMVTGDKDLLQLVKGDVFALRPPKKGEKSYRKTGEAEVFEEFGIYPYQMVDYLALIGDSSDNVPGVAGIGPKGAQKLLESYKDLDTIYNHLDELTPKQAERLTTSKELAYLSKDLVTLRYDVVDITNFDSAKYRVDTIEWKNSIPLFEAAQARSIVSTILSLEGKEVVEVVGSAQEGHYHGVESIAQLEELLADMAKGGVIAFDLETTSLDELEAEVVGFSFTNRPYEAWYVPLIAGGERVIDADAARDVLRKYLIDNQIALVGQNLKYDYKVLSQWGLKGANLHFDTMLAAWLLDSATGLYNLDYLAERYLNGYKTIPYNSVVEGKTGSFSDVPLEAAIRYGAEDADITWRLFELFEEHLKKRHLEKLFRDLEMPLVKVLAEMELQGILLDTQKLATFDQEVVKRLEAIEKEIFSEVGFEFNLNSPKQLQEVLFEKRGLPATKKIKSGYSTATDVLEQLAHLDTIPALILQNRGLVKLKNTYIDTLPTMINPHTGRIHTSYTQTGTATGRLSSRNPNLQNIPVRNEDGRRIREAFIPQEGSLLLSADYAQIELVVLAHLADDPSLKEAFLRGEDIHTHTASLIFNMFPEFVTSEQRRIAKTINFGVMYGMSAFRLSNELQISRKDAQTFIDDYFARFAKVNDFMEEVKERARKEGRVATLLGRERSIPEINSRNATERAGAERIAVNSVIQGTAADIMKLAMLRVSKAFKKSTLRSSLLLQVHDELIFEVIQEEMLEVQTLVKKEMEGAYTLSIPLKVNMEVGRSWGEMV